MTVGLKDAELQKYYEALFSMYGTPGWRMLMEDVSAMILQHDSLSGLETAEDLWNRKGMVSQMRWLAGHQSMCEAAYANLLEEDQNPGQVETGGKATVIQPDPLS